MQAGLQEVVHAKKIRRDGTSEGTPMLKSVSDYNEEEIKQNEWFNENCILGVLKELHFIGRAIRAF